MRIVKSSLVDSVRILIICLILFSYTVFYQNLDKHIYYIYSMLLVISLTGIRCLFQPAIIKKVFVEYPIYQFSTWLLFLFLFFVCHAFFVGVYKSNMFLPLVAQLISILVVIVWLCDLSVYRNIDVFIKASILTSFAIICYLLIFEREMFLVNIAVGSRLGDGEFWNSNYLALYLYSFFILILYRLMFLTKKHFVNLLLVYVLLILIMLTGSKKAILSIFVCFSFFFYLRYKKNFFKYLIPFLVILFFGGYMLFENETFYRIVGYRIENMLGAFGWDIGSGEDRSTGMRKGLFVAGLNMVPESLFLGHGLAYFETHSIGFNTNIRVFHTHNNALELLINYGVLGFLLYYSMFVSVFVDLLKNNKTQFSYLFIVFLIIMFGLMDTTFVTYYSTPIFYLFLYFAFLLTKGNKYKNIHNTCCNEEIYFKK